jgi:polyisoprenoid-binding protein YceI
MTTTTKLTELTGAYVLDTAHTRIGFVARQAMVTKVRGQFDEFEGGTHLDGGDPSKSSAQLTIKAKSIQTRNDLRDEHLRSHFLTSRTTRPSPSPRPGSSRSRRPASRSPVT